MNNEKKKFNPLKSIPLCLCSLMFVASFALFAVSLALSLVDITAGGHISFTASCVNAKVTGTVTGTKTTNTLTDITLDESVENFTTPDSWKNMTLDFTKDNLITLTISIQNLSTENSLWVKFTDGLTVTNVTTSITLDKLTATTFPPVLEIPTSTTKTAVITLKVDNIYKSVSSDFTLNMELSEESALDASTYTTLSFTYNDENLTASVKSKECVDEEASEHGLTKGSFIIPSRIKYNDKIYTVTEILDNGFANCHRLTSIVIPGSITKIGSLGLCVELRNCEYCDGENYNEYNPVSTYAAVYLEITEGWNTDGSPFDFSDYAHPYDIGRCFSADCADMEWTRS